MDHPETYRDLVLLYANVCVCEIVLVAKILSALSLFLFSSFKNNLHNYLRKISTVGFIIAVICAISIKKVYNV